MHCLLLASFATLALGNFLPYDFDLDVRASDSPLTTCKAIAKVISKKSAIYYPGSEGYANDTEHWVPTASENSTCTVEPGTTADVVAILKVLGTVNTPFGVKGGGHAVTKGFSSSPGVLIAMRRFNSIVYDKKTSSVTLGLGGTWDTVYNYLAPLNVTVSGGRITGVGIAGYLLGGGYAWISNNHGLSMDSVISYELVLPNATVVTASNEQNQDLFWGLKIYIYGGYNNFGIVTYVTTEAYYNGLVYAGLQSYSGEATFNKMAAAVSVFHNTNKDPNANCAMSYFVVKGAAPVLHLSLFHQGPTPPPGTFAAFDGIPYDTTNVGVTSFAEYIRTSSVPYLNLDHLRGTFSSVSVPNITESIALKVFEVINYYAGPGSVGNGTSVSTNIEPFIPSRISRPLSDGAWPHKDFATPLNLFWQWTDPAQDAAGFAAIDAATKKLDAAVKAEGQPTVVKYPNYSLGNTPVVDIYGVNLPRAKALRKAVDPKGIMLRAGGYKFI